MNCNTRKFLGILFTQRAEPLLQVRRNSGVVCQVRHRTFATCCCRKSLKKGDQLLSPILLTKRNYHKKILQHLNDSKDEESILQYLKKSVVYHQDGLIAINKPPGLGVSGRQDEDGSSPLTLASMMPDIADITNCPSAEIAQGLDKEISGLVLLGENKEAVEDFQRKTKEARNKRQFIRTYKAIVCAIPEERTGVSKMYLGTDVIQGVNMTIVRHSPSGRQIHDGDVWSSEMKHRVISENKELGCALLELQPLRVRRHQLQVHLVNKLCPVLGDHIYSHQIKTILGRPMLMDPYQSLAIHNKQVLSRDVRKSLGMTKPQVSLLPLFLHLHHMVLPEWAGKQDITIAAPLPPHFTRALKQLGLSTGTEDMKQLTAS